MRSNVAASPMPMRKVDIVTDRYTKDVIARIPIGDDIHCEMDLSSYHALLNLGYVSRLGYTVAANKKYVSFRDPVTMRHILVARMLAGCRDNQICKYKDGNPLNLRLDNLRVV